MGATEAKAFDAKAAMIRVGDAEGERIVGWIGAIRLDAKVAKDGTRTVRAHLSGAADPSTKPVVVGATLYVGGAWVEAFDLSPEATTAMLETVGGEAGLAKVAAASKLRTLRREATTILLPSDVTAAASTRKAACVVTDEMRATLLASIAAPEAPEAPEAKAPEAPEA